MIKELVVETSGERIDTFLSSALSGYSRSYFQKRIRAGAVTVNGESVVAHYCIKEQDRIVVDLAGEYTALTPEEVPLSIIHEDDDLIVVNKAAGLVVHPACGHQAGTLLNAFVGHAHGKYQPFLVHRLDKDTSGLIVAAKNESAKNSLASQFQNRTVSKIYLVAVSGCVREKKGRIEAPLGRSPVDRKKIVVGPLADKMAVTDFTVIHRSPGFSLIEVHPLTGRTHQIRSHMAYIGHPVLGDVTYGGPRSVAGYEFSRQMLHAWRLSFAHPATGKRMELTAPPPHDLAAFWKAHTAEMKVK